MLYNKRLYKHDRCLLCLIIIVSIKCTYPFESTINGLKVLIAYFVRLKWILQIINCLCRYHRVSFFDHVLIVQHYKYS